MATIMDSSSRLKELNTTVLLTVEKGSLFRLVQLIFATKRTRGPARAMASQREQE